MASDLARYLFSASFTHLWGYSPRLDVFPPKLLPDHFNVKWRSEGIPFKDRFRVQCKNEPATTVVTP
jgi:DNA (cytosine-5)-methyltransferase 1